MTDTPEADAPTEPVAPPKKKSDLGPRLLTAAIGIPILIWMLFWAPAWCFAVLIGAAVFIATWEYMSIVTGGKARIGQVATCLCAVAVYSLIILRSTPLTPPDGFEVVMLLCGCGLLTFIVHLFTFEDREAASLHIGASGMSMLYCALLPSTVALLFRDAGDKGGLWVVMLMAVVWGSDTGAYFAGRAFGKHKLAPKVSPKKTIEGALGGLVTSVLVVLIFKFVPGLMPELELWHVFALAIPANILGQIGDLCESLIKRAHGVKDSGVIIYGHGGLLDRIDALIFAAPWVYLFYRVIFGAWDSPEQIVQAWMW